MTYLGAYRFTGTPAELLPAYERLMRGFDAAVLDLHICAAGTDGIVVIDGCPSERVFREFSTSHEFRDACRRAGLPDPTVEHLGSVHQALVSRTVKE